MLGTFYETCWAVHTFGGYIAVARFLQTVPDQTSNKVPFHQVIRALSHPWQLQS